MTAHSEMHRVTLPDGHEARVYDTGRGEPILLLHGWSLDHRSFAPQIETLAGQYRVLCFDRRGFGSSTAPPDLSAELGDIDCILDALRLARVHLLGISQAARLALRYAVTRTERLLSVILQGLAIDGCQPNLPGGNDLPLDHYQALARVGDLPAMREAWLAHPMMTAGVTAPAQRELLRSIVADYRGADLLAIGTAIPAPPIDVQGKLKTLQLPVLVVTGELEAPVRKAHATALVEAAPLAQEVVIAGAGHLSNLTAAAAYNAAVLAFLITGP